MAIVPSAVPLVSFAADNAVVVLVAVRGRGRGNTNKGVKSQTSTIFKGKNGFVHQWSMVVVMISSRVDGDRVHISMPNDHIYWIE
jgi:hypothetical protein